MINADKLTVKSAEALNEALAVARRAGNPLVYDLHLLYALLAQDESIVTPILQHHFAMASSATWPAIRSRRARSPRSRAS